MEKPESLSKSDYNLIHKDVAKKLLSTNNEKWNTIPRTYSEIDTLRAKFEMSKFISSWKRYVITSTQERVPPG